MAHILSFFSGGIFHIVVPIILFVFTFVIMNMALKSDVNMWFRKRKAHPKWFAPIARLGEAAGTAVRFDRWLFYTVLGVIAGILGGIGLKNTLVAVLLSFLFGYIPTFILSFRASRYRLKMVDSLASGIEVFSSEYVALNNLAKSFDHTASQLPEPVRSEFSRMAREMYTGYRVQEVLEGFRQRVNNRWARQFVNLLLLREERGADIEEGLFNLVKQMKTSQIESQREKAEMAQVRIIHLILTVSAIGLFIYNLPGNYTFVTTDPLGRGIVSAVAVLLLISVVIFVLLDRREVE